MYITAGIDAQKVLAYARKVSEHEPVTVHYHSSYSYGACNTLCKFFAGGEEVEAFDKSKSSTSSTAVGKRVP